MAATITTPDSQTGSTTRPVSTSLFPDRAWAKIRQGGYSLTDQVLSVGGMFLVNVVLARTVSKTEYGLFALSYSVFTFLAGLHNAAILEAFTVFGAGRYRKYYRAYAWLIWRSNALLGLLLTSILVLSWIVVSRISPAIASPALLGLGVSCGVLLTALLIRRMLYVQNKPHLAATFSSVFFLFAVLLLWVAVRTHHLNGFSAFAVVALGWIVSGLVLIRQLPRHQDLSEFVVSQPNHWREHWKYSRWVLLTACVFQLTTQGYYWVVAGFLSLKNVAELRAMYMLVGPVDQVFGSINLLVLPILASCFSLQQFSRFRKLWKAYLTLFLLIGLSYAGLAVVAGHKGIHLLYGGKFDDVAGLFALMGLLPIVMGVGNTINVALKAAERPDSVFYAYLASGSATLVVGVPLVIRLGLRGAIWGMLVSAVMYTLVLAVQFVLVGRTLHEPASLRLASDEGSA